MTTTQPQLTAEAAINLIDLHEGTGADGAEFLLAKYGEEQAVKAAVIWCLDKFDKFLEPDKAWEKVWEWCERENVPLKGKYRELCQKQVQAGIDGHNGNSWLQGHNVAVLMWALSESVYADEICTLMRDFAQFVYPNDMDGLPTVTEFQYNEASEEVLAQAAKKRLEKYGYKGLFEDVLYNDQHFRFRARHALKGFVGLDLQLQLTLIDTLIDCDCIDLQEWLCADDWYTGLEEAFTIRAKEIYKSACIGWDLEGAAVLNELSTAVRQALAKGGVGSDEILSDKELAADIAQVAAVSPTPQVGAELLSRIAVMEQAGVAPQDILIRTGYFKEDGDYSKANIDFFSAKIAAQKADGSYGKQPAKPDVIQAEVTEEVGPVKEAAEVEADNALTGADLLQRLSELEAEGVAPRDILIATGYYSDGGDYGAANMRFFDAKMAAQKAAGTWAQAQQESKAKEAALEAEYEEDYPELKKLLSPDAEVIFEERPEDARKKLDEIVRSGQWPKLP